MDKFVGKRLDGRYEIQEIIGVGGMAVVYKAHDNVENRTVAIKILKDEFISNDEFIRRFKNESKAIAVLSHPNIVKVYDVSFGDLIQYIVMEYIDGITLKEFIERQGSLRWKDAVYFTIQILKALQHAHDKGIVHRDVKPQNIMVLSDGTIKVADFGIARFARNEQRTITDKAIGSVHYISPEQARGEKTDEKADIYSVGVMLYEMLTGQLPFEAESAVSVAIMQLQRDAKLPTEINPAIPLGLEQITMHAMQKTTERRYQSASEFLCDLEQFKKDPESTFDYSYFVDNSPTKYVDSIMSSTPASAVVVPEVPEELEEVKEKNNMIPILVGIASALLVAIIAIVIIFLSNNSENRTVEVECPQFVGMSLEEIERHELFRDNVLKFTPEYVINDEYDIGVVCDQSFTAGKKLKTGDTIILYISQGQNTILVPNVYGKTESYAKTELESQGFTVAIKEKHDNQVDAGLVIETEPKHGTHWAEGAEITVYISLGKETKMVKIPNLVGLTQETAVKDIEDLFENASVEIERRNLVGDENISEGRVITQEPGYGETVPDSEETKIKIYISTGVKDYKYKVTAPIRDDFKKFEKTGYVSIWTLDGEKIATSSELDFTKKTSYTFDEMVTNDKTVQYTLKVSFGNDNTWYNYSEVTIDSNSNKIIHDSRAYDYEDYVSQEETPKSVVCDECLAEYEEGAEHNHILCENTENGEHQKPEDGDCIICKEAVTE